MFMKRLLIVLLGKATFTLAVLFAFSFLAQTEGLVRVCGVAGSPSLRSSPSVDFLRRNGNN